MQSAQGLWISEKPDELEEAVTACVQTAQLEAANVVILPELALALPPDARHRLLRWLANVSTSHKMIVVAGSYYDENRFNRLVVVGPGWLEQGYKIHPSRYEVSPSADSGMREGPELLVVQTDYGNLAVITCVDLLSDEVQFLIRRLATSSRVDVVISINHNPAAWEFLIEMNSLVRRHPVFASITNTWIHPQERPDTCLKDNSASDTGYCNGHTAILADLRTRRADLPNSIHGLISQLPTPVVVRNSEGQPVGLSLAYNKVVGSIGAFREALLLYQLNLRLKRVPRTTNAPDQGYPPIKDVQIKDLIRSDRTN